MAVLRQHPHLAILILGACGVVGIGFYLADATENLVETVALRSVVLLVAVIAGLGIVGTWWFISRLKRNEAELERAMLTDSAPVMIAYVDRDKRYQFANKSYRDWFGKSKSEIERSTVRGVLGAEAYKLIGPNLEMALRGQTVSFETRLSHRTEGMCDAFATYTPDIGPDGAVRGVVVAVTDTTRVKQLEQYLDSILLNLPVGVAILEGPELRYFRINQMLADLNGLSVEEHLGRPLAEVLPDLAESLLPVVQHVLETSVPVLGREFSVGSPDKQRHLVDYLFPIEGADGRPKAVGAVVVDVTERKALENRVLQSQKMEAVGTLAGGIAHDFNNIIMVIMGSSELLAADMGSNEDLDCIREAANHAAALARRLLTFSRPHASAPEVVDPNRALFRMEKILRRVIGAHIQLVVVPSDVPCWIRIDPDQFEQVLMNLALNSREAMQGGGRLDMRVHRVIKDGAEQVMVSVTDTGAGMSDADQRKMFDPFFTTTGGTGLGLSTCFGIVKQSGGHIEVASELGEGTTIRLYFPLVPAEVRASKGVPASRSLTGTETILFVEDERSVRAIGVRALQDSGYAVLEAGDGEEALAVLKDRGGSIDMMITDMVMPNMSGRELIEHMRDDYPDVSILCTTGYTEEADMGSEAVGRLSFLQKPYEPSVLRRKIRDVLDGQLVGQ